MIRILLRPHNLRKKNLIQIGVLDSDLDVQYLSLWYRIYMLIRSAIFRYKRDSFPIPSEAEKINGTKRYVMVEDLTSPTYSLLKAMKDHPDVSKAYTIEGRIRYSKVDKPDFILKVKSVFEPIEKILSWRNSCSESLALVYFSKIFSSFKNSNIPVFSLNYMYYSYPNSPPH